MSSREKCCRCGRVIEEDDTWRIYCNRHKCLENLCSICELSIEYGEKEDKCGCGD